MKVAGSAGGTEMLCGFVREGEDRILGFGRIKVPRAARQALADMKGKMGATSVVYAQGTQYQRMLLAGIGSDMEEDTVRFVSGKIAQKAAELGVKEFSIVSPDEASPSRIVEGVSMSLYRFDRFKSKKGDALPECTVVATGKAAHAAKTAGIVAGGVEFTRNVANMPPNECTPAVLAGLAKKISRKSKIKCIVITKAELKRRGFGGITAVGQGSSNSPRLIIMEYDGGAKGDSPTVLVGKAVTFDTGGISIKPSEKMDEMKFDKCGGCTVLGILKAASEMKLGVNLVGIVPAVENMPGGDSYRPGDIIRLYSKKTAEIMNTDAEGRLILADAISYGERHYRPRAIIDFATLTGACIVALGNNVAGMVSNDREEAARIMDASSRTSEQVWELPLNQDYMDMIKSDVADMKNIGIGRAAGTITAAAFLRNAIEETPWVHIDIAGVAWTQAGTKEKPYNPKGATGFGVRLVMDYLQNL